MRGRNPHPRFYIYLCSSVGRARGEEIALKGRRFESGHRLHVPVLAWVRLADSAWNCGQFG